MTSAFTFGQALSRSATCGAASSTCSKLSRISSTWRDRRCAPKRSLNGTGPASAMSKTRAIAGSTFAGSLIGASDTNQTPSAKWLRTV